MGMSIDEIIAQLKKLKSFHNGSYGASINLAIETMRKYQILQADYENRLKADLVAMLTDIQLEIEELETGGDVLELGIKDDCKDIIQQKIHTLKEQRDEKK